MTGIEWIIWVGLILLGFTGSALYSGMETGAYRINRIRLHILAHQQHQAAAHLKQIIDHPATLLSTVLIGTNVMNYLGTASLAVILDAHAIQNWQAIVINSTIITPLLFIIGEVLPKDLFAIHSDKLMYPLATLLVWSKKLFTITGMVPLIGFFSGLVTRKLNQEGNIKAFHPRRRMEVLVKESVGYGLISDEQSAIIERVLGLATRRVSDEMIPWNKVIKINQHDSPSIIWEMGENTKRSHFPVIDQKGLPIGIVHIIEILMHPLDQCPPISQLLSEVYTIEEHCPIQEAMSRLRKQGTPLAIVVNTNNKPVGLVTMKDLVEPITGELKNW